MKWWTEEQLADLIVAVITEERASEKSIAIAKLLAGPERWAEACLTIDQALVSVEAGIRAAAA